MSIGFINQNFKILDGLVHEKNFKEIGLRTTAVFLPLIFPRLFDAMTPSYRQNFERLGLKSFQQAAEKSHIPYAFRDELADYGKYMSFLNLPSLLVFWLIHFFVGIGIKKKSWEPQTVKD